MVRQVKALSLSAALVIGMTSAAHAAPVNIFSTPGSAPGSLGNQVSGTLEYDQGENLLSIELTNNATDPDNHIVGFVFNVNGDVTLSEHSFPSQPDSGPWQVIQDPTQNDPFGNFDWGVTLTHMNPNVSIDGLNGIPNPSRGVEHGETGFWELAVNGPDASNLVTQDFLDLISPGNGNNGFDAGLVVRLQGAEITDKVGTIVPSPAAAGAGLVLLGGLMLRRGSRTANHGG